MKVFLTFDAAHFSALVPMESNSKTISHGKLIFKYKYDFLNQYFFFF